MISTVGKVGDPGKCDGTEGCGAKKSILVVTAVHGEW